MKIAVVYKSLTGNTKLVADAIAQALTGRHEVYVGEPTKNLEADFYFIGSWTDKGSCAKEITEFLKNLEEKQIAVFGTAGFGGSDEYYNTLFERVEAQIPTSNHILGQFYCQGKMPMSVRDRYVSMMKEHPEDKNLEVSVKNFDEALSHPNEADLKKAADWACEIIKAVE